MHPIKSENYSQLFGLEHCLKICQKNKEQLSYREQPQTYEPVLLYPDLDALETEAEIKPEQDSTLK